MQRFFCRLGLWVILGFLFLFPETAFAAGYENYQTVPLSEAEQSAFLTEQEAVQFLTEEDSSRAFQCFAVSEAGQIALGCDRSNDRIINVYNTDGDFLYGYRLKKDPVTIFFEKEQLSILWIKMDYIGSFDARGNCTQLRRILGVGSFDAYNGLQNQLTGQIGELRYAVERGLGGISPSFTRFTLEDDAGNTRVIYDAADSYHGTFGAVAAILCMMIAIGMVSRSYWEKESGEQGGFLSFDDIFEGEW